MKTIRAIQAEFIKLKYLPLFWLVGFVSFAILAILFSSHFADVNRTVLLGKSPWSRMTNACVAIYACFMASPFVILFISAAVHVEHQAHGWKQLFSLPQKRESLILAKVSSILLILLGCFLLLIPGLVACGYLLDSFFPELEFKYWTPPIFGMFQSFLLVFIELLGIIGIQLFLSIQFKGFLIPSSFGIIAFVMGIILGSLNNPMAHYFPYSYPIVARDRNLFMTDKIGIVDYGFLNSIELYSMLVFVVFVAASLFWSKRLS